MQSCSAPISLPSYTVEISADRTPEPRPSADLNRKPIPPHRPPAVPAPVVALWAVAVAPWAVAVALAVLVLPVLAPAVLALPILALAVPALAVPALAVPALAVPALAVPGLVVLALPVLAPQVEQVDALLVHAPPAVLVGTRVVPNVGSFRDSFSYLAARRQPRPRNIR